MVTKERIWELMEEVFDPEVPVLTVVDLGVVRDVDLVDGSWKITITPTYSGCPAMKRIEDDILEKLAEHDINNASVDLVLSPAWTTDWLSESGKRKLSEYGIAPPVEEVDKSVLFAEPPVVPCPKCGSKHTKMVSQFGSTACKAHYQCQECLEPFDYFKCLK
ncbi:MAG: 1,2-phenylacetyl-CoA epoxidase subunit PaaD [Crocinitomicaceae bacterium]